jgi:hypothetical protein
MRSITPAQKTAPRIGGNLLRTLVALGLAALTLVGIHQH